MEVLKQVLSQVKPSPAEEKAFFDKVKSVLARINRHLNKAKAELGGSGAKGTWMKDAYDIDIFVRFDLKKYKDKDISKELLSTLKKEFKKIFVIHGSRDYYQAKEDGFTFEIVPVLAIKKLKEAQNIMDMSPFHVAWVAKQVKKNKKLSDEVRLAKAFCKANSVYGAESYINGFSGYVLEILIAHYGNFMNLVKNAVKWKAKVVIDVQKFYKNKNIMFELNAAKLVSPLIIVDPVQADRNAAAALSEEKFDRFVDECKRFISKSSADLFRKKDFSIENLRRISGKNRLIVVDAKSVDDREDVAGTRLLKVFEWLRYNLSKNDFKIRDADWTWDKQESARFYFVIDSLPLPNTVILDGPPLKAKNHVEAFKKAHKKTFEKKGKMYAEEQRKYKDAQDLAADVIKEKYVKEKVISIGLTR